MKIKIEIGVDSAIIEDGTIEYKRWVNGKGRANWLTIPADKVDERLTHLAEIVNAAVQ